MARSFVFRTVEPMDLTLSSPNPENHVMLMRAPAGTRVEVAFFDEEGSRDLTQWVCDLGLLGLSAQHREAAGLESAAQEQVEVARVALAGADADDVSVFYVHAKTGVAVEFSWHELAGLVSKGLAVQITAGVAAEADQAPDDAAGLQD